MKNRIYFLFLILAFGGFAFVSVLVQNWELKTPFTVKFINPEATGSFTRMTADIAFSENDLKSSRFDVNIDVNSIDIGSPDMSKQALSADMLNAKKFPSILFNGTEVTKTKDGYAVKGSLTLHGVKNEVEIPFTFPDKTFKGSFSIKAKDYGINSLGNGPEDILKIELAIPVKEK